jgi:DNA-binding transcriptional LysR family regulator
MLDLRQMRTFRTVAAERSFTRAAALLNYAQSSITAQVHALEEELGVPLFDRLGRQVELTAAGHQLLSYADRLLELAEEAKLAVHSKGEPSGPLTVSASESLLTYRLPELLRAFQCRYPAVNLSLHASLVCTYGSPLDPGVDVALTIDEPVQGANFIVERLRTEPMVTAVSADHVLAKKRKIEAGDLVEQQILLTDQSCSYRALFERTLGAEGVRITKSLDFASVEAIKQCALARMGVAVLPEFVLKEELAKGSLVALAWPEKKLHVYTQMIRHKDKWVSPVVEAFWKMAAEMIGTKVGRGAAALSGMPEAEVISRAG